MRILFTISLFIISLQGFGQTLRHFSLAGTDGRTNYFYVYIPSDSAAQPTKKRPIRFNLPGQGEQGTANDNITSATKYGSIRERYLRGWNGKVSQGDSIVEPIDVWVCPNSATHDPARFNPAVNAILNKYAAMVDTNQIHMIGISLGGKTGLRYITDDTTNLQWVNRWTTITMLSPASKETAVTNRRSNSYIYARNGGRVWIMSGSTDAMPPYRYSDVLPYMNPTTPGSATGRDWTSADTAKTGHEAWEYWTDYQKTFPETDNKSVYNWQMQFTKAPIADAQDDITTTSTSVTLNGITKGWYKTKAWTKISGTGGTITSASSDTTTVTGLSVGTYVFRLTVTNTNTGSTSTDDVTVTINPTASAPLSDAGSDQSITTSTATLTGSGTPGGSETITGYLWTKTSGTGGTITSPTSASTGLTGLTVGTYVYRLTVTQSDTQTNYDEVTITVSSPPPTWQGYILRKKNYQQIRIR